MDNYEYELPSDFEDEEIDEEAAFNDADKKLYGDWFGDRVATDAGDERDGGGGLLASSDEDDVDEYDPDDFSEEEASDQVPAAFSVLAVPMSLEQNLVLLHLRIKMVCNI